MKVRLDENLPHAMRLMLAPHDVVTVAYLGWSGVRNGDLLRRAAEHGIDVMVTLDRGIEHEQNLSALPVAIVLLLCESNQLEVLRKVLPDLLATLATIRPKTFSRVGETK